MISTTKTLKIRSLKQYIINGFPRKSETVEPNLKPYIKLQENMSVEKDLILYGSRLVIPEQLRKNTLKRLHSAHQGIERTKRRARETVYWPGINNDIATTVTDCRKCQEWLPSQRKEPLLIDTTPTRVFQEVSADIFTYIWR